MNPNTSQSANIPKLPAEAVALDLRSVSKVFRSDIFKKPYMAVDNLSLRFDQGKCTGLLGHNGAGKTTTIRMILGLIRPDTGSILFEGRTLTAQDKHFIGYMPEVNKLPLALTSEEILEHTLKLYASDKVLGRTARRQKIIAKLDSLGLTAHKHKKVAQLSKGMARRLAFAQATIHEPRLLILDEPSTGLDPHASEVLIDHIEAEKSRGTTISLCTHELHHVSALCDAFYLLRQGQLIAQTQTSDHLTKAEVLDWGSAYGIQVSGLTLDKVQNLRASKTLPMWQSLRAEGQAITISFAEYPDAARWLSLLLGEGYLILRFGDGRGLTSLQIRNFFRGQA